MLSEKLSMIELNKKEIQIVFGAENMHACIRAFDYCWLTMPQSAKGSCSFPDGLFIDTDTQVYYDLQGNVVSEDVINQGEWVYYCDGLRYTMRMVLGAAIGIAIPFALRFVIKKIF